MQLLLSLGYLVTNWFCLDGVLVQHAGIFLLSYDSCEILEQMLLCINPSCIFTCHF